MRIERSTLDQVKNRFELNKQKKTEEKKKYDLEKRLQELEEEVSNITLCRYSPEHFYSFTTFNNGSVMYRMYEQKSTEEISDFSEREKQLRQSQV